MGNKYCHTSEDIQWTMVGRSNDIQKLTSLIEKSRQRQVNITGLKKIGKSRVMVELAKRINANGKGRYFVLFVDFDNVYVQDHSALYELILDAIKVLEETKTQKELIGNEFGIAEKDPHSIPDEKLKVSIKRLITSIASFSEEVQQVLLFLDNVEKLMASDIKHIFLDFVNQIIKRSSGTKCVLASSIQPCFKNKNVIQYELGKLTTQEIIELLFEITENRDGIYQRSETYTEIDGRQYWFSFSNEMEIFKPKNQIYINIIAELCEGLPLAAEVSGTLLTEDDCVLEPSELVEILIMGRLSSLSPENCLPDERLGTVPKVIKLSTETSLKSQVSDWLKWRLVVFPDQYKDQMAQVGFKEFFDNLNENIQGCEFGIVEAKEAVGDDQATTAVFKKEYIKKAMQICVQSANKMSKEKRWIWHSVLREGQGLLQLVELLPEGEQAKEIVLRFIENNIKTAELEFTEDILKDMKSLEQAILSLRYTALTEKNGFLMEKNAHSIEMTKQALQNGKETVRNVILKIVGHSGVGKTTLVKKLLGATNTDPVEPTDGIEVHISRCTIRLTDSVWIPVKEDESQKTVIQRLIRCLTDQSNSKKQLDCDAAVASKNSITSNKATKDLKKIKETKKLTTTASGTSTSDAQNTNFKAIKTDVTVIPQSNTDVTDIHQSNRKAEAKIIEIMDLMEHLVSTSITEDTADVSIWDFAGQYVFYSTHQVFLSKKAVYLIVTDLSKHLTEEVEDDCYIDAKGVQRCSISDYVLFWLQSIYTYCAGKEDGIPNVIIVGTFADKLPKEIRTNLTNDFFDNLRETLVRYPAFGLLVDEDFDIDNTTDDPNIERLKNKIFDVATKQSYWEEKVPVKWIDLERILVKCRDVSKVMKRRELEILCTNMAAPIGTSEELESFLRFHHESGNILYFSEDDLRDHVVLDPQWLIDAFKTLITAKEHFRSNRDTLQLWFQFYRNGSLPLKLIDDVWTLQCNKVFMDDRDIIIQFLEKLGIIAKPVSEEDISLTATTMSYFVPCMLKEPPPKSLVQIDDRKNNCISTSVLCFASEDSIIPTHIFNKTLASCIARWPISKRNAKPALFCGFALFDIGMNHQLHVYFRRYVIHIWISRYSSQMTEPDNALCNLAREYILDSLKHMKRIRTLIKCPIEDIHSDKEMFEVDKLLEDGEVLCSNHEQCHVLTKQITMTWFFAKEVTCDEEPAYERLLYKSGCSGFPLRKSHDDTLSESLVKTLLDKMKSVGVLVFREPIGTVFRVGTKYVMTASHVLQPINGSMGMNNGIVSDSALRDSSAFVSFNEFPAEQGRRIYRLNKIAAWDIELDFAIIEISNPDNLLPPGLQLCYNESEYENLKEASFVGYGHPKATKKILDPRCTIIPPEHEQIKTARKWLKEKSSLFRTILKLKGTHRVLDLLANGYTGIDNPDRLIFHCFMRQCGSGSPALTKFNDDSVKVVGILTHALPEFYFHLDETDRKQFEDKYLFEMGTKMSSICRCIKNSNSSLASDIFPTHV